MEREVESLKGASSVSQEVCYLSKWSYDSSSFCQHGEIKLPLHT